MNERLEEIKARYDELTKQLSEPDVMSDQKRYRDLAREHSQLADIVRIYAKYRKLQESLPGLGELAQSTGDDELRTMAAAELRQAEAELPGVEDELKLLLVPRDPNDAKNVIVEIRAGTGGEEAALFAADLFRMYTRYAEQKGWKVELIDENTTGLGGFKEVVFGVSGEDVYGYLKYESGVHRVQRVPSTEASGRIHTSAASVAVLPEAEEVEVEINPTDLRIDVYRAGGHGGQNVNKVETAIRITHIATGIVVQCQDERSQYQNRLKAMRFLRARLYDHMIEEKDASLAAQRRSMVRSGDRSEKIRTYNFPQNRVTDHRIGLTLYNLSGIIDGSLDSLIEQIRLADRMERLNGSGVSTFGS
ncbi:MAG: peptide chain release factor 1 [Ignavibacteriales bacterium CG07_land_8_20_14_0_80_59_12]|nr:MAG: peptide chain release factor 1 [Ignavibacteriales bacterium CG07_land_8_20_14_0_80_59_12]